MADARGILAAHFGASPQEGAQWSQKHNLGIAHPGLRKSTITISYKFKQWLLHLNVLVCHMLLQRMLAGTEQENEGVSNKW
jgi:hypothetical protein